VRTELDRTEPERSGTVVVLAWVDGGFRARITCTPDLANAQPTVTTVATVDEACAVVAEFLTSFESRDQGGDAAVTGP
jgi:hypothetical protein